MMVRGVLALALIATSATAQPGGELFGPDDLARLATVAEPAFSPDGQQVAYSVKTTNLVADEQQSDLWRTAWHGAKPQRLTYTPDNNEWMPQFSPDGRWLAFLSDRGGEDAKTQVWVMPAKGGKAKQVTKFPEGVEDFALSPDGRRLAVIAWDPERADGSPRPKNPPPIVIRRYQFKEDGTGYLTARRKHLYVVDVAT
ncbi:MAG TPA: LpqB family beta-propeller domain-containing protein, partial [Sphingomicrobium sp.]|nr:LpqB family beta-propeller domain-containing protein [Sphingomicrobium sp.]